ncbi:type II toxin-antitoxin system HicB family antitoxin [Caldicellulosiruptor morganii]|uniref:Type II toxin-antitoxin system HicB family antitoxin n=1 Tax=Caldicellulosiruptor morganii TaxID=1387555 RepID=A0ABY7BN08_9FIRM|nr:type II toxin-antitoxin system HicB family antitoxin [Caldicellulosiruptor morganii]WAM33905.1 type II toxin-antitoxin system HicB family antitoxin [Caldicellulosiruptor morganii]
MKKESYVFPAIFTFNKDGITIEFPDLPGCISCADTLDEAVKNAKEVLGLYLWSMEKDDEPIPEPTPVNKLKLENNQIPMLIEIWMPLVRHEMDNKAVKKTLTIPQWLNILAEKNNINFSQVLQEALKEKLGIDNYKTQA